MDMSNVLSAVISTGCKVLGAVLVMMIFLPTYTAFSENWGNCTMNDVKEFQKNGFSLADIRELCKSDKTKKSKKTGQRCQTRNGVCGLYHLPPAVIGTSCYCVNKYSGFNEDGRIIY